MKNAIAADSTATQLLNRYAALCAAPSWQTLQAEFRVVCSYLGWGDIAPGTLTFCGIEGSRTIERDDLGKVFQAGSSEAHFSPAITQADLVSLAKTAGGRPIRTITCKIASGLSESGLTWREYRDKMLWVPGSGLAQLNLLPLDKPTVASWPDSYRDLFGFGSEQYTDYRAAVRHTRYELLRAYREVMQPSALVCFGMGEHAAFREAFAVQGPGEPLDPEGRIIAYSKERTLLVPFFAYRHMSHSQIDLIVAKLSAWGVRCR